MAYRPTISVYLEGRIIDIGYYRNWNDKHLFYEAMAIAAFLGDCRTREEYLCRRYGVQDISYSVYPVVFDSSEKSLKELEECSEMPVLVDLTARCIYAATAALPEERLREIPSVLDDLPNYGYRDRWKYVPKSAIPERHVPGDEEYLWIEGIDLSWEKVREPITDLRRVSTRTDFYTLLDRCRIPYGRMDMEKIRYCYLEWTDNGIEGLSQDMLHVIRKRIERSGKEIQGCGEAKRTIKYKR